MLFFGDIVGCGWEQILGLRWWGFGNCRLVKFKTLADKLVTLAGALRALKDHDLEEAASTRLLVYAATLIKSGMNIHDACRAALVEPLTDDEETIEALVEVVNATLGE